MYRSLFFLAVILAAVNAAVVTVQVGPAPLFVPQNVTATVGDTIFFQWQTGAHSVTQGQTYGSCVPATNSTFNSGVQNNLPFSYNVTASTNGTFYFYCINHCGLGMYGKLTVNSPVVVTTATTTTTTTTGTIPTTTVVPTLTASTTVAPTATTAPATSTGLTSSTGASTSTNSTTGTHTSTTGTTAPATTSTPAPTATGTSSTTTAHATTSASSFVLPSVFVGMIALVFAF